MKGVKPWMPHIHRCTTKFDETGYWGECLICHRRFGVMSQADLMAVCDADLAKLMERCKL